MEASKARCVVISPIKKKSKSILFGLGFGIIVIVFLFILMAAILCTIDLSDMIQNIVIAFIFAISGFISGFICGKKEKEKGFIMGGLCGIVLSTLLILFKLFCFSPIPTALTFIKMIVMILSGAVGGILGVNQKSKRIKC